MERNLLFFKTLGYKFVIAEQLYSPKALEESYGYFFFR